MSIQSVLKTIVGSPLWNPVRALIDGDDLVEVNTTIPIQLLTDRTEYLKGRIVPAGAVVPFHTHTAPAGWLSLDAAQTVLCSAYPDLVAAVYNGDGNNANTDFVSGYKCTDTLGINRSTAGQYLYLAAFNDFIRGTKHSAARWSGMFQLDSMQGHIHKIAATTSKTTPATSLFGVGNSYPGLPTQDVTTASQTGDPSTDGTNGTPRTSAETRPRSMALMYCIKF